MAPKYLHSARTRRQERNACAVKNNSLVAQARSGQIIGVKTILYLVIAVAMILLAVMLLSRLYNALIGGSNPAMQDARLVANTINDLLKDERDYIQVPLLLRVSGDRIVGFTQGQESVDVPKPSCKPGISSIAGQYTLGQNNVEIERRKQEQVSVKTGCQGKTCICSVSGTSIDNCFSLSVPKNTPLYLAGDYQGYSSCLLESKNKKELTTAQVPAPLQGDYTEFVIDRYTTTYPAGNTVEPEGNKRPDAIIPVIIEKRTIYNSGGKSVAIIIAPDSEMIRGREYYLYVCPDNAGNKDCYNKTGASSMTVTEVMEEGKAVRIGSYCAPSLSDAACNMQKTSDCKSFCGFVNQPCLCDSASPDSFGNRVATYGFCSRAPAVHIPTNCNFVQSCSDYCLQDGDEKCTSRELTTCSFDACGVAGLGNRCEVTANNGNWDVLTSIFDPNSIAEQCVPKSTAGAVSQVRAVNAC